MFLDTASKQFHADDHSKCVQIHKYQCSIPTTYINPVVPIDVKRVKFNAQFLSFTVVTITFSKGS